MAYANNEKGNTMLETIMYIGLLIMLGGAIANYVGTAFTRYKTGRVTQQIIDLKKAVVQYTAASADYKDLRLSEENNKNGMMEDKALPMDMKDGKHALGGRIQLGSAAKLLATPSNDQNYMFYITFENLPQASCTEVLTQGQFCGDGSDMDTLIVNNDKVWRFPYSLFPVNGLQIQTGIPNKINIGQALDSCYKKTGNAITWIFS